ncbi:MAG: MBL fold metallo-hydrolase [Patescibacteria group bacterium]|jgi:glyoxylase-like metal-dependent hydrolase (beta-lactamase superfamily II)
MTKIVRLTSFGGWLNTYLLIGEKIIIVDTGYKKHYKKIINYLKKYYPTKHVSLIILTHAHLDHYEHAHEIKSLLHVPILIHKVAEPYFRLGSNEPTEPIHMVSKIMKSIYYKKRITPVNPDIIIEKDTDLTTFGIDGLVLPTPGHTQGSLSVIVNKTDCLTGDLFINFGKKSAWFINSQQDYLNSIEKLKSYNIQTVYPSHGRASKIVDFIDSKRSTKSI